MSARSVTSRRKYLHSDTSELSTFAEVLSEPWPTEAGDPYICRFADTEDSDLEWEELPDIPGLFLANMGPFRDKVRMRIYGTEMDVCKTNAGVKALRGWKSDPSEIALYERPDPKQPVLKLVGVYPVVDGYAQLNLQDVQTGVEALHAFPGSLLNKLFGWPLSRAVE